MTMTTTRTVTLLAGLLALLAAASPADAQLSSASTRPAIVITPNVAITQTPQAPKENGKKNRSGTVAMFKDLRPGSCATTSPLRPPSSWPARGTAAITFCQR